MPFTEEPIDGLPFVIVRTDEERYFVGVIDHKATLQEAHDAVTALTVEPPTVRHTIVTSDVLQNFLSHERMRIAQMMEELLS